ncbi:MAG: pyruvate kinase [Candidatus Azotimanducaceae bacterium]|jgi:pyruvate kinase
MRNSKIVATLGPASDPLIAELVAAGVDVFRLNFSHGGYEAQAKRVADIRAAASAQERYVAIMADLQGPKIRIGRFKDNAIQLLAGDLFQIDPGLDLDSGTQNVVGTTYPNLTDEVKPGDTLVLGDGTPQMKVTGIKDGKINLEILLGGELGSSKGINLKGGGLSAAALTEKDIADLEFICSLSVDYVAVSFVRNRGDVDEARRLIKSFNGNAGVIAKIERAEAVASEDALVEIILASDAVMVARGDLGIEIGDAALMGVQKHLVSLARRLNRSVITATQMMESMVTQPQPTRAEVMDVANAVLDGTDAVMLSGETAVGAYPVETVLRMVDVINGAEQSDFATDTHFQPYACKKIDEAIAMAAMTVAANLPRIKAVVSLTASGNTPKLMSRSLSRLPIYALARDPKILAKVALFRGVHPRYFQSADIDYTRITEAVTEYLREHEEVSAGDRIVLSQGDENNVQGGTNSLKILEVVDTEPSA